MKYELGQLVYYMINNRIHSARINTRMIVENAHDDWCSTDKQKEAWQPYGISRVMYSTCHGEMPEEAVFASHEDLTNSL